MDVFNGNRRRNVSVLLLMAASVLLTGCLDDPPADLIRLHADAGDRLAVTVDAEGWFVSLQGDEGAHVTEQVVVETTEPTLVIIWRNEDDRFHEIMFHRDHSDHDAIRLNPGDSAELHVDNGFEQYVHSHHAPEMPEILIRVQSATR